MRKPRVFIGSSSEGLPIAEALFACLAKDTIPTLWTHQLFLPGHHPLEDLEEQIQRHSFAVLVASPDDQIIKRGTLSPAMRDNILVEFGLFTGALGRGRTIFVCPDTPRIALPSDYFGITYATYDANRGTGDPSEIAAAVQVACNQIRHVINKEWLVIERQAAVARSRLLVSERAQAIRRLQSVAAKLRDSLIAVERDAFAALDDKAAFGTAKRNAVAQINQIAESFKPDAETTGVGEQLQALTDATIEVLHDLPFPQDIIEERRASRHHMEEIDEGVRYLKGISNEYLKDDLLEFVSDEITGILGTLTKRYEEWWERHYAKLQEVTARMQDALFHESMQLVSTLADERGSMVEQEQKDPKGKERWEREREGQEHMQHPARLVNRGQEGPKPKSYDSYVGEVIHYYDKIGVAMISLTADLVLGERVKFVTRRFVDLFEQEVTSMRIDHKPVKSAGKSQCISLQTAGRVIEGALVFKTDTKDKVG